MATNNAFGTPTNLNQFQAIVNGSKSNSLVSQLLSGKAATNTSQTTPMVSTPNVVAASSQVKSPSQTAVFNGGTAIPTNAFGGQSATGPQSLIPNTLPGTNGAPMSGPAPGPASLLPPTNQPVTSHSVTDAQGNTVVQKYDTSATNTTDNSGGIANPNANYTAGVTQTNTGPGVPVSANSNSTPPSSYLSAVSALSNAANGSTSNIANTNNEIENLRNSLASDTGSLYNEGGTLNYQTGRIGALQNQEAAKETAAESKLQNELTAQGQTIGGLTSAASDLAPGAQFITPSYSSQVLDSNGQPAAGTGGTLQTAISNAISQIKAGSGYQNAAATLSSFGPAGTNALLSALGPSFNINASNAEAAAQASNIGTQGTLNTTIGAQGAQQATQNYVAAQTAYQTASSQATNLQNTLATTGINNNPQFVNQKINALSNQLGSQNYASFITALNETKQAYTSLLASVGASTPTVNDKQATDIFDANSTPTQINAAIDALNQAAYAKLQPLYEQIGTYSNIGSSNSNANSNSLYSF